MNILGIDLGTNTGWCYSTPQRMTLGTWTLATDAEIRLWGKQRLTRRNDPRVRRLFNNINSHYLAREKPDVIVYEDVQFSSYTLQVQLWSSLRAAVWLACGPSTIIECVPVSTLKKFATGHGGATKEMMIHAAVREGGDKLMGYDDNAIDAYHLMRWAQQNLSRIKTP